MKVVLLVLAALVPLIAASDPWITTSFSQPVDHAAFRASSPSFDQRILYNDTYWCGPGCPVLFYTGNEGSIEWFAESTSILFEVAPKLNAMLVWAEHRYYGHSLPFGNSSYASLDNLRLFTTEQALADFARVVTVFGRQQRGWGTQTPVISVGGSYGGMLSAWFRIKYPNVVQGALAASAPVAYWANVTAQNAFYNVVTADFGGVDSKCAQTVQKSWPYLMLNVSSISPLDVQRELRWCDAPKNGNDVFQWVSTAWSYLAMVNYPYAANFLMPLPAWPVDAACKAMAGAKERERERGVGGERDGERGEGIALLRAVYAGASVYYNYTGEAGSCFDVYGTPSGERARQTFRSPLMRRPAPRRERETATVRGSVQSGLGASGWDYQACTEMVMPMSTTGTSDMFPAQPWDFPAYIASCRASWGADILPDEAWAALQFESRSLSGASNIIFSNGNLDPWWPGGVLPDTPGLPDSVHTVWIEGGAHHLDLRASHEGDPEAVKAARVLEWTIVAEWCDEWREKELVGARRTARKNIRRQSSER